MFKKRKKIHINFLRTSYEHKKRSKLHHLIFYRFLIETMVDHRHGPWHRASIRAPYSLSYSISYYFWERIVKCCIKDVIVNSYNEKIDKYVSIDTNKKPEGVIALRLNQIYGPFFD